MMRGCIVSASTIHKSKTHSLTKQHILGTFVRSRHFCKKANRLLSYGNILGTNAIKSISILTKMHGNDADNFTTSPTVKEPIQDIEQPADRSIVDDYDLQTLTALEESYSEARRDDSSKWLEYMKSCYIYLYRGGGEPSSALVAFDLDGTIIKPKGRNKIPKSATDWQFFSVWTKVKLQQAIRENQARFVMFTNQNGVGLRIVALEEVQERIELVTKRLDIPCTVFVAIEKDEFRKPKTGMFRLFDKAFNGSMPIDYERSFYCGDAVGYPSHSDADIKFARTLGLPFLPPDKFVRGVKPKFLEATPS